MRESTSVVAYGCVWSKAWMDYNEHETILEGDGYVHYLHGNNGFIIVTYVKAYQSVHSRCTDELYLNKFVKTNY